MAEEAEGASYVASASASESHVPANGTGIRGFDDEKDPIDAIKSGLGHTIIIQRLAALVAAWAITVAPTAFAVEASASLALVAFATGIVGVFGVIVGLVHRRVGRHLAITVLLAMSVAVWVAGKDAIGPQRMELVRALCGAVAWGLYALSWSEPWEPLRRDDENDPSRAPLRARATLPAAAVPVAAVGAAGALVCLAVAWAITDPDRALFGHAGAAAASVLLLTSGANLATSWGKRRRPARTFSSSVLRTLGLLVVVALAGAVLISLR